MLVKGILTFTLVRTLRIRSAPHFMTILGRLSGQHLHPYLALPLAEQKSSQSHHTIGIQTGTQTKGNDFLCCSLAHTLTSTLSSLPTSPSGQPARSPLAECLSVRTVLCVLIREYCGVVLSPCSEPGIALISLNAQQPSVLSAVFLLCCHSRPWPTFFCVCVSVCYVQAPVTKQKRVLFMGCPTIGRILHLPHQQMRCKVQRTVCTFTFQ